MAATRERVLGRLRGLIGKSDEIPTPPWAGSQPLEERERVNRRAIEQLAAELGPVFAGPAWGETFVCIVGLARCRRFLAEHPDAIRAVTQDLTGIVPLGPLRSMEGEPHTRYRRALLRGLRHQDHEAVQRHLSTVIDTALAEWAAVGPETLDPADAAHRYIVLMTRLSTEMLIGTVFGCAPGSEAFERLRAGFHELGPFGFVWHPGPRQVAAYAALTDHVRDELARRRAGERRVDDGCLLTVLDDDTPLDDTMLKNLLHMVESGRSDITANLRWLTWHSARQPEELALAADDAQRAKAFVTEVLRTDQSERFERAVTRDVVFEGFRIPAGTRVRLCAWESHHDPEVFPDPHRFDPSRFLTDPPATEVFAPFGIDHHQCPFGSLTVQLGTTFVQALARGYRVTLLADGRPARGPYHWEPARSMVPRFERVSA